MIAYAFLMAAFVGVAVANDCLGWAAFGASFMVGVMLTVIIDLQHEVIDAARKK